MLLLLLLSFVPIARSINLPANDINLVVVTDVHSWVAGHKRHEPKWDADYGHVLSFYEQLKSAWSDKNLFFVMNGDFMDGTGLSTYPPSHLTPILQKMPWDALNIGNHELYQNSTIEHITSNFTDFWGEKYITSNVLRREESGNKTIGPLGGSRYTVLEGPTANVLVFGFLYNMIGHSPLVAVEPVEQVIEQEWFTSALTNEDYQAIVVLAHMDVRDELTMVLLSKIRATVGNTTTVQFISGHTHIRAYQELDNQSTSFEAGHYLDTVGFISFSRNSSNVEHVFIEANVNELTSIVGVDNIMTDNGRQVQNMILSAQEDMQLIERRGCSPDHYYEYYALSHPQSLWRLYMDKVINSYYFDGSPAFVFAQGSFALRYDLFRGEVTLDDIKSVCPFNDTVYRVTNNISGRDLVKVFGGKLNDPETSTHWKPDLPEYVCSVDKVDLDKTYEFYTVDFDLPYFVERVANVTGEKVEAVAQATGTTQLWLDFVSRDWQKDVYCEAASSGDPLLLVVVGLTFAAVIIAVLLLVRRRRKVRTGYNQTVELSGEPQHANSDDEDFDTELI